MIFAVDGVEYDSRDLLVHMTGDRHVPLICQTKDHARVFVATADYWSGMAVHEADAAEIKALAARYAIDDLRRALR